MTPLLVPLNLNRNAKPSRSSRNCVSDSRWPPRRDSGATLLSASLFSPSIPNSPSRSWSKVSFELVRGSGPIPRLAALTLDQNLSTRSSLLSGQAARRDGLQALPRDPHQGRWCEPRFASFSVCVSRASEILTSPPFHSSRAPHRRAATRQRRTSRTSRNLPMPLRSIAIRGPRSRRCSARWPRWPNRERRRHRLLRPPGARRGVSFCSLSLGEWRIRRRTFRR